MFTVYINNLEEGTEYKVPKFADDTKVARRAVCDEDIAILQRDMDRLDDWVKTWQMEYNVAKCEVMHFDRRNYKADYYLNGERL